MPFRPDKCFIPTVYCGDQDQKYPYTENDNRYVRHGTPNQCMKKGFGAALARENKKNLPAHSIQQIRYVGPKFSDKFSEEEILTTNDLIRYARNHSANQIKTLLERVFQNANRTLNGKGYNSTLLFLHRNGVNRLPECVHLDDP